MEDSLLKNISKIPNADSSAFQPKDEEKSFWAGERKESEPEVKIKIAFGPHGHGKDWQPFEKDFADADIFIPEMFSWSPQEQMLYERISGGLVSPSSTQKTFKELNHPLNSFRMAQINSLYKSGKVVRIADMPIAGPTTAKTWELVDETSRLSKQLESPSSLDEKIPLMRKFVLFYAEAAKRREDYMIKQIPKSIKDALQTNPKLKKKDKVNVMISLGFGHTNLYHRIHNMNSKIVERKFPDGNTTQYSFYDVVVRRLIMGGKIEDISDEDISRALLDKQVFDFLNKSLDSLGERKGALFSMELVRDYIKLFNLDDIRDFYAEVAKGRKFRDVFLETLKKKGVEKSPLFT